YEAENAKVEHPRLNADLVCIADLATWTSMAMVFFGPPYAPGKWEDFALSAHPNGWAVNSYISHSKDIQNQLVDFTPIGTLICQLIQKRAWEDPACRDLDDYYRLGNLAGPGAGLQRLWPTTIYSDEVRNKIARGMLRQGVNWDEWLMGIH